MYARQKIEELGRRGFFTSATIEVTSHCNHFCRYCYIEPMSEELTTEQWCRTIDRLASAGAMTLTITGGEVFCRPDIDVLLKRIFQSGFFQVSLLTNGTLIEDRHVELMAAHAEMILNVRISFFSHIDSVHDSFTRVPGSFKSAFENAMQLKNRGVRVAAMVNLISENVGNIQITKEFFANQGFEVFEGVTKFIRDENTGSICRDMVTEDFYSRYFNSYSTDALLQAKKDLKTRIRQNDEEPVCKTVLCTIGILPDGRIVPCISFRKHAIGNVKDADGDLQHLFCNSSLMRELKALRRKDVEPCNACEHINYCTLCPAMMYHENGNFLSANIQNCNYVKALKKQAVA